MPSSVLAEYAIARALCAADGAAISPSTVEYSARQVADSVGFLDRTAREGFDSLARLGEAQLNELRAIHDTWRHPKQTAADELVERATRAYQVGFFDKAEPDFLAALSQELNPYEFRAAFHLGHINLMRGALWPALNYYREAAALALAPKNPASASQIIVRFIDEVSSPSSANTATRVEEALEQGNQGLAAQLIQQALCDEPLSRFWGGQALVGISRALVALRRPRDAAATSLHAVGLLPQRADAWYELARCAALGGDDLKKTASAALVEAFFLAPPLIEALAQAERDCPLPTEVFGELKVAAAADTEVMRTLEGEFQQDARQLEYQAGVTIGLRPLYLAPPDASFAEITTTLATAKRENRGRFDRYVQTLKQARDHLAAVRQDSSDRFSRSVMTFAGIAVGLCLVLGLALGSGSPSPVAFVGFLAGGALVTGTVWWRSSMRQKIAPPGTACSPALFSCGSAHTSRDRVGASVRVLSQLADVAGRHSAQYELALANLRTSRLRADARRLIGVIWG